MRFYEYIVQVGSYHEVGKEVSFLAAHMRELIAISVAELY
jgi:hypothetical protein